MDRGDDLRTGVVGHPHHGRRRSAPTLALAASDAARRRAAALHAADLPDHSLDAVLSAAAVHEMAEPIGMLAEIRWLLAPTATDAKTRAHHLDQFMEHNKFTRDDLRHILSHAGFVAEDVQLRNKRSVCQDRGLTGDRGVSLILETRLGGGPYDRA